MTGGPSTMSSDLTPGRIRLDAAYLRVSRFEVAPASANVRPEGEFGPSWSSAIGGGLGSLGDLAGEATIPWSGLSHVRAIE